MNRTAPSYDKAAAGGMVVRAPRQSDAIGGALRRVYGADRGLPPDLAAVLGQLARVPR